MPTFPRCTLQGRARFPVAAWVRPGTLQTRMRTQAMIKDFTGRWKGDDPPWESGPNFVRLRGKMKTSTFFFWGGGQGPALSCHPSLWVCTRCVVSRDREDFPGENASRTNPTNTRCTRRSSTTITDSKSCSAHLVPRRFRMESHFG